MTYFPVEEIIEMSSGVDTNEKLDPERLRRIILLDNPNLDPDSVQNRIQALIRDLPPPEMQRRIVRHMATEAERHGFVAKNFRWWDILPPWKRLHFSIFRECLEIPTRLYWKTFKTGADNRFHEASLEKDVSSPIGWAMTFEDKYYQTVRRDFIARLSWLDERLAMDQPFDLARAWETHSLFRSATFLDVPANHIAENGRLGVQSNI